LVAGFHRRLLGSLLEPLLEPLFGHRLAWFLYGFLDDRRFGDDRLWFWFRLRFWLGFGQHIQSKRTGQVVPMTSFQLRGWSRRGFGGLLRGGPRGYSRLNSGRWSGRRFHRRFERFLNNLVHKRRGLGRDLGRRHARFCGWSLLLSKNLRRRYDFLSRGSRGSFLLCGLLGYFGTDQLGQILPVVSLS
jgi:hypothetical protein